MKIRPEGTIEMCERNCARMFPPSRRDGLNFVGRYQPLRSWLISGCAFGTSRGAWQSMVSIITRQINVITCANGSIASLQMRWVNSFAVNCHGETPMIFKPAPIDMNFIIPLNDGFTISEEWIFIL